MKPFNLEEAKAGKSVVTRYGIEARIICFDRKNFKFPLIVLLKYEDSEVEITTYHTEKGEHISNKEKDLFMKTEKKTGWVNVFVHPSFPKQRLIGRYIYDTKEEAIKVQSETDSYVTSIKIEWEE